MFLLTREKKSSPREASVRSPRVVFFSPRSAEKPTVHRSRTGERRHISRFSLSFYIFFSLIFFSLFFFLPQLIPPEID
ncbi:hypothetical protein B296_00057540 [Ensete ventricosum]|uniref:Transmembrane protein n=1 Tax=Ensete ventricosum TaxID=4639 RepID=A0A426XAH7_ENSVE|nr:hypothetical protein B296_00057540 [Ensete ventricosum]